MALQQIGLFPLLSVAFALLAFFIGYAIAIKEGHVDPWLPFISDCGCLPPESNIFGQLLNVSCFFLAITVYLIHRNMTVYYEKVQDSKMGGWKLFSTILMLLGWFATFGASMVANFQEGAQLATHDVGAFMFFIGITIYFWGQIILGYGLRPRLVPIYVTYIRTVINLLITGLLIFHMVCLFASPFVHATNGKKPEQPVFPHNIERYNSSSPFYNNHLAATTSEWALALLIELFVLTYTYDFAFTILSAPTVSHEQLLASDDGASKIYYTHQVAPLAPITPIDTNSRSMDYVDTLPVRRLPRVDQTSYGTYSGGTANKYNLTTTTKPYVRENVIASYSQYQYY